tara:strand:+ start:11 stop:1660 length:1650 start_codon:yes stop_codon:yes gene_type:complete
MAGTTDTVPAMLTPGEFVIKQESAAMLGEPLLRKLNAVSDSAHQGFEAGGGVSQNIGAHGNIDALIIQAQLANMKLMYGGGEKALEKGGFDELLRWHARRGKDEIDPLLEALRVLDYRQQALLPDQRQNPEADILESLGGKPFAGYENGGDVGEYATREKPGRYKDPIHKYISDMILAGKQDMLGGLLDDDYYKPLVEQELRFMNLQNLVQSAEDAIPSYSGKKEGIDLGDIFGEQSWLKQRGKKKSIRNVEDIMGETLFGQRINELYANNLYGLDNNTKGFQEGGGVTDKYGTFSGSWGEIQKIMDERQRLRAERNRLEEEDGLSPAQRLFQRIRARQGEKEIPMTPEENEWLLTGLSPSRRKWRDASTGSPPSVDKPMTSGKKSIRDYIGRLRNGASDYEPEKPSLPGFEKPSLPWLDNEPALPDMGYRLGYQEGGGVGEAGRKYPPGTLMSPFMGDTVSPQDKTATTPFQSPEQAAEFERMIKMLQIQEILKKAKESQTYDAEMIESDGKSILPPWQGKRNFKGNLYEEGIQFPVYQEGNPQIKLR